VYVTEQMVGHKLGEFAATRTFKGHAVKAALERAAGVAGAPGAPAGAHQPEAAHRLRRRRKPMANELMQAPSIEAVAMARHVRMSPQKVRLVIDHDPRTARRRALQI